MGAVLRNGRDRRCLVVLSDGGQDATVYREFDLETATFVRDGFVLPTSKQGAAWIEDDTLVVSRDLGKDGWGGGSMTTSGYPYIVKTWRRGEPLHDATEIARGHADDQLGTYPMILRDGAGADLVLAIRRRTFFTAETIAWSQSSENLFLLHDGSVAFRSRMGVMKTRTEYLAAGAFGAVVLGSMIAVGYVEDKMDKRSGEKVAVTTSLSERQMLERRRGRMAEVAIVGTTAQ